MSLLLKSSFGKLTFIVDTMISIGMEYKGGSIVLHKLSYELAKRGHHVYVFNEPFYKHENIEIIKTIKNPVGDGWKNYFSWEAFAFDLQKTISIFPQVTYGNNFNTIHNVRWILHDYKEENWKTYSEHDVIFNYGTFKVPTNTQQFTLTTFDYNFDKFYNMCNPSRKGYGHIIHKNTPEWGLEFIKNFGSTEIPHYNGSKNIDYLLQEFNKYEYILTFDHKSFYTTAAALCGAISIILNPDTNVTPLEYRLNNPIQMCGVAYGFDDLEWAKKTLHLTRNNLFELEKKDNKTIDNFIEFWKTKILY